MCLKHTNRYTHHGYDINCWQRPLDTDRRNFDTNIRKKKFAYVWYAASNPYLCSALTAFKLLKKAREREQGSREEQLDVDFVLTYVPSDLKKSVDQNILK